MADTLYQMSEERGDLRMQAVALALKLDYYYFQGNNVDSIIHYTNIVKDFAEKTNQLKYYYCLEQSFDIALSQNRKDQYSSL